MAANNTSETSTFQYSLPKYDTFNKPKKVKYGKLQIIFITLSVLVGVLFLVINIFFDGKSLNNLNRLFSGNQYDIGLYAFTPISNFLVGFCIAAASIAITVTSRNVLSGPTTLGFTPMIILANTATHMITIKEQASTAILYSLGLAFCFILITTNFLLTKGNVQGASFRPILISFAIGATVSAINIVVISQIEDLRRDFDSYVGFKPYPISLTRFLTSNILMVVVTIILFLLSSKLTVIKKDFILAKSLGIHVNLIYWTVAFSLVIITVSAIVLIGIIALIGVVINVIISALFKRMNVPSAMLYAGLFGSAVLSFSGYIAEFFAGSREIIIAILAIPAFVYVLFRRKGLK
ncbi:iron chelate uptake ABC transporter family permease subunit [Ureaplasma miroungigenitalium]|uniref:iron chelate uptake ABC transporter family permease subunit n=1 Tax=Ureaplasma miroungigenitalium TaxID=1042321 RepID=UPI0021E6F692|nr:iron chelate uptake ABC transporter family permease subunit [Ureaplasma miroungigenitalium]MCV3734293.1 iron chelate uptake ABC transporter family permease subunit [Ureaplasma miroungigenitalium]